MAISVGSVSVDVVPSTRGFAEQLKAKLKGITANIAVEADTTKLRAQLDEAARSRSATINATADTTAANAQLDAAARPRDASIRADARGVSGLLAGIVALGPALVPITAAVAGLGLALGAPLAAAGGGLTVFGLIAGKQIANTNKVAKQIADLKKRANTLVDPKAAASALSQAKALEASLTGPQKAFLAAKTALAGAFETLNKTAGRAIFRPVILAMQLLGTIMPQLAPVVRSVSGALSGMIKSLGDSAKSGALKDFLAFLGEMSGPVLTSFGVVLGNLAVGFGGLFKAFAPVAGQMTTGLLRMSGAFADFGRNAGSNNGLQSFVDYVRKAGPQVVSTLGSLIKAIVAIGVALAPFGGLVLVSIKVLADAISALPTPVLAYMAGVIGTLVLGLKLWAIAQGVLNVVMAANPIGIVVIAIAALVVGLIAAYKSSETFRKIVNGAFKAIGEAAKFMWDNVLKPVFKIWLNTWFTIIGAIVNGAARAFGWVRGIGGKLRAAADKFNQFRDSVNRALDGIHSVKEIRLNVTTRQSVLISSINKPRTSGPGVVGATGGIVNRPTVALIGEAGPEAVVPLNRTAGNGPLPTGGLDTEQSTYRAMTRALRDTKTTIMSKPDLDALDLLVGAG